MRYTLVDSASATIDPEVYDWLDDWLTLGRDQLHIVSMHIAPIDPVGARSGSFASRNEANIPTFIAGGGGAIPEKLDGIGRHFLLIDVDPNAQTQTTTLVRVD